MKKLLCALLTVSIFIGIFAGCKTTESKKIKIVTTVFSCYDWTKEIIGEKIDDFDLKFLLNNGVDLHSYQLTSGDLYDISTSSLFVYVGGESDEWVEDVLKSNKDLNSINMMEVLNDSLLEEEVVEGMQVEEEGEEEEEEEEFDEHIWLSFRNASVICDEICSRLCKIDGDNADIYKDNTKAYKEKLVEMFNKYKKVVDAAETKTLLVADRFPFRYLANDYGLKYYAAFKGCSSECDATFATITGLADKLVKENLACVIVLDGSDKKLANSVISGSKLKDIKIYEINSMQTATVKGNDKDETYLTIAESNLSVLTKALKVRG